MENNVTYKKRSIVRNPILIGDQSSIYLNRFSAELKYIVPWAQYDNCLGLNETNICQSSKIGKNNCYQNIISKGIKGE